MAEFGRWPEQLKIADARIAGLIERAETAERERDAYRKRNVTLIKERNEAEAERDNDEEVAAKSHAYFGGLLSDTCDMLKSASEERDELRAKLRERAIKPMRGQVDGMPQLVCDECGLWWHENLSEDHAPDCLARPKERKP